MGLFRMGKTDLIAKFHRTDLVIVILESEESLSYS